MHEWFRQSKELISSVQKILKVHQIKAPLMIVKGDGSLASVKHAIEKLITIVLSGPAASVIGACRLRGARNHLAYPVPIIRAREQINTLISKDYIEIIRP